MTPSDRAHRTNRARVLSRCAFHGGARAGMHFCIFMVRAFGGGAAFLKQRKKAHARTRAHAHAKKTKTRKCHKNHFCAPKRGGAHWQACVRVWRGTRLRFRPLFEFSHFFTCCRKNGGCFGEKVAFCENRRFSLLRGKNAPKHATPPRTAVARPPRVAPTYTHTPSRRAFHGRARARMQFYFILHF